jgi:hypothetical protein
MPSAKSPLSFVCIVLLAATAAASLPPRNRTSKQPRDWFSGIVWQEPKVVTPGDYGGPPSDAVVLFDGHDLSKWIGGEAWEVKDGYAVCRKQSIITKDSFGDCQLHLEFATPAEAKGSGQGRGNSGVILMNRYEIQVLDSFNNKTYFDGQCGAVYKQTPPMVNACRKPGEWQTYDILWEAPRFTAFKTVERPPYVTVLHNGVVVQNHTEVYGGTGYDHPPIVEKHPPTGPIRLQFHGQPVRFRNIWVREMKRPEGQLPSR